MSEKKPIVAGTFGGEGVLDHERRITTSNNASDYSGAYTDGFDAPDGGVLSFQPNGFPQAAVSNDNPQFTMPDEDGQLKAKASFRRAGGEPVPQSFGGNNLLE